jgi:hypothetical protein
MAFSKMLRKLMQRPDVKKAFKELKQKNTNKTVNVTAPKSKPVKYASIGKTQMAMGRSGTVVTSGGLLTNNKTTIKKKKLLGA